VTRTAGDLTDRVFGTRTVLSRAPNGPNSQTRWNVQCGCGRVSEVSRHCLVKGEADRCNACRSAARYGHKVAGPATPSKPDRGPRTIADAIQPGLTVNTLRVVRTVQPHAWMLACQVCNTLSEHRRNAILSGAAVCPTCRPSPRAKLQAASAHP
jgi:hypothetical protein